MPRSADLLLLPLVLVSIAAAAEARQSPPPAQPPPAPKEVQPAESRLQFYGILRQDVIFDDSRPDAFQSALFILSEPPAQKDRENFTMYPRLSRLGINVTGPTVEAVGGARLSGRLEIDFQNGGRESRAIPRFRHVFLNMEWSAASLLVGQTWDVISPLFPAVNADTLMWNVGNLGDRRPQVRLTLQRASGRMQWSLATAVGLTSAVDAQDLDNDGVRDGEAAAVPTVQARFGTSVPIAGTRRLTAGVWTHVAREKVSTAVAGETEFSGHSFGADVEVPILTRGIVRGELWTGENLSDVRGGIGQAINSRTGDEIRSRGGWVEVGADLHPRYSVFVGYTIDSPESEDVPSGGRTRNAAWFIANKWNARPFGAGVDYLHWTTRYAGAPSGTDNRVNAYVTYSF